MAAAAAQRCDQLFLYVTVVGGGGEQSTAVIYKPFIHRLSKAVGAAILFFSVAFVQHEEHDIVPTGDRY